MLAGATDTDAINSLDGRAYNSNWDGDLMPCLPYAAQGGESILKVRSYDAGAGNCEQGNDSTCLDDVAILTVLDNAPPTNAFRPPFVGTNKPIFTTDDLNLSALPTLPTVANTPSIASVEAIFGGPWIATR